MAFREITELSEKTDVALTDELWLQETGGGDTKKATLNNIRAALKPLETEQTITGTGFPGVSFTGISSFAKRITINLSEFSLTHAGSNFYLLLQVRANSATVTSGYSGVYSFLLSTTNSTGAIAGSSNFQLSTSYTTGTATINGQIVLNKIDDDNWVLRAHLTDSENDYQYIASGVITLSDPLDGIEINTSLGVSSMSGAANLLVE